MTIVLYINGRRHPITIRLFRRYSPTTLAIRTRIEAARARAAAWRVYG